MNGEKKSPTRRGNLPSFERKDQRSSELASSGHEQKDRDSAGKTRNGSRVPGFINGLSGFGRINGLKNGRINGFINGSSNGRINGLRNGKNGRINGLVNGLVNGNDRKTGLVNGNGFINGFRLSRARRFIPLSRKNPSLRIAMVFAVVALVIVVPFLLMYSMPPSTIKIDGYFFDWDRAGYFHQPASNAPGDIAIREYSIVVWRDTIYGYISTSSDMFAKDNSTVTSFFAFFDMDNNPNTGYQVDGIGADTMAVMTGWNGTVKTSLASDFMPIANKSDFGGFKNEYPVNAMGSGNKLEFSFTKYGVKDPTVRFMSKNSQQFEDESSLAIRYQEPALRVLTNLTLPAVIPTDSREAAMNIELDAQRGDFSISRLDFKQLGNATKYTISIFDGSRLAARSDNLSLSFLPELDVREGYGRTLSVYVETDASQMEASFGLSLDSSGVSASEGTVTVTEKQTLSKAAYIGSAPHRVVIDGAFADWTNGYIAEDPAGDVRSPNGTVSSDGSIDIRKYGMYADQQEVAMYLSVEDRIMNGTLIPRDIHLPVPTTGLPNLTQPELIGADVAGALIDTDLNATTGANVSGVMGADYLVFIAGKKGHILLSELYVWNLTGGGGWDHLDSVKSAVDSRNMEFAFNLSDLPLKNHDIAAVSFFMTDWKEGTDTSDSLLPLAAWQGNGSWKAFGGIVINEVHNVKGAVDWIEIYNTGSMPISLNGWTFYNHGTPIYTFGNIVLNPGGFFVAYVNVPTGNADILLMDNMGLLVDSVTVAPMKQDLSYARTGNPPYSQWAWLTPTPGGLNPGQVPIPEFSSIIVPVLGMSGMLIIFRARRRSAEDD